MRAHLRGLFAALGLSACLAAATRADEPEPINLDTIFSVSKNSTGGMSALHGGVMLRNSRPEACFDLIRNRGGSPELNYLVLLPPGQLPPKLKISFECASNDKRAHGQYSLDLAGKPLKVKYDFEVDSDAQASHVKSIELNGEAWKADGPRVFLADISGDVVKLKPVKARLPEDLPTPDDDDLKHRLRRVIEVLARDHEEVRQFLKPEKKEP